MQLNNANGASPKGKQAEDIQQFVQVALPALVELVRKGTRFTPESIEHLRDSFKEVLNSTRETWKGLGQPEGFGDFVGGSHEDIFTPKVWTPDSSSQSCQLCLDKFTYSNRRHHCRTCGALCCDACSMKRLHIKGAGGGGSTPPPSSGSNKKEGSRVCDSCFNRYNFLCTQYHQNLARMKKEMLKREKEQEEANKAKLTGGKDSPVGKNGTRGAASATAQTSNTMNETMRALEERGQRLENTAERSEQLKEVDISLLIDYSYTFALTYVVSSLGCIGIPENDQTTASATATEKRYDLTQTLQCFISDTFSLIKFHV